MKKRLLSLAVITAISLTACHLEDHTDPNKQGDAHSHSHGDKHTDEKHTDNAAEMTTNSVSATPDVTTIPALIFDKLDWSTIPASTMAGLTSLQLPEGMKVIDKAVDDPEQYSTFTERTTLNLYNGKTGYKESGNLTYFDIGMIEEGEVFDKARFDADIPAYMKSIGAVEIYNDKIPLVVIEQLKASEGLTSYDYMNGETESTRLKQYVLNHENGSQLIYQISSNNKHGQIGLLEISAASEPENGVNNTEVILEESDEVEKMPTASDMKTELDKSGKAVLNINFDTGRASIRNDNLVIIEQILTLLKDNPDLNLSIEGHTDSVGSAKSNLHLSKRRAEQVRNVLIKRGIEPKRLKAVGYGEGKWLFENNTVENRAKNRRVELVKF